MSDFCQCWTAALDGVRVTWETPVTGTESCADDTYMVWLGCDAMGSLAMLIQLLPTVRGLFVPVDGKWSMTGSQR
jgi:hypothetical protein